MPVQTRSHGRSAPALITKLKDVVTPTTTTKSSRATPKKTTAKRTEGGRLKKTEPGAQRKRKTGIVDKLEGIALKIEGTLTGRAGVKGAGTKKIRGTDGKGSHKAASQSPPKKETPKKTHA